MQIVNIHNKGRLVYCFCRDEKGNLTIKEDNSFFPYYYERGEGDCKGFDGVPLRKLYVTEPREVARNRSADAYEADILFNRRYMIDKVTKIDKGSVKYAFIDIEVLADELPNVNKAKFPVSCISVGNSQTQTIKTFWLPDYNSEWDMVTAFIDYMKEEKFDIWLSWNVQFDYNYLYNRFPDFAKNISPIGQTRYGDGNIFFPAGISIVDYLSWFKKVTLNKEKSYALDQVAQKYFEEQSWGKPNFGELTEDIKEKNINDIKRMVKLENKFKMVTYFDEIRRLSKVEWEDLLWNSRIIDMLLLEEAKNQKIVLPMKPKDNEKEDFEGAYREAYSLGAHWNIGKYDLSSAYPNMIIDFCLDPSNILSDYNSAYGEEIEGTRFEQNGKALLPTVCRQLLELKMEIGKQKKVLHEDSPEYADIKKKYDAIKAVVNSAYGVMGNRFFRLYDKRVASATTFLVREVLHYVKDKIEEKGYKVIYVDTDSVFIDSPEDLTQELNNLIMEWAQKYNKTEISTKFEYEGMFSKLLILAKCRYIGYYPDREKPEIKGVEAKRKDSTEYMKVFQRTLIDKILNKEPKEEVFSWIKNEVVNLPNQPLENIAFPCKLARPAHEYKNTPIFLRAMNETDGFDKKIGDSFFYIYVEPDYYHEEKEVVEYFREVPGKREGTTKKQKLKVSELDEIADLAFEIEQGNIKMEEKVRRTKKARDVKAFDEETSCNIMDVDWDKMTDRNIYMKISTIFNAMGWDIMEVKDGTNVRI